MNPPSKQLLVAMALGAVMYTVVWLLAYLFMGYPPW